MRLLRTKSLRFKTIPETKTPPYAILSHTWGKQEVTFQDIKRSRGYKQKVGWSKIAGFARKARNDGYKYIWVDTCCIDKSSSAELSEAINSMYRWYQNANHCYVYLDDVQDVNMAREDEALEKLQQCRWFTRGWTLQELLAPSKVIFCDSNWTIFGWVDGYASTNLVDHIARITCIPADCIKDNLIATRQSVSQKMSWAARRETTRLEDEAYCLLGLFGVNMPLLYGEGQRAFRRLQEEILKESEDHTLLTWHSHFYSGRRTNWMDLASSPADFLDHALHIPQELQRLQQVARRDQPFSPWSMTSRGLRVELPCISLPQFPSIAYLVLPVSRSSSDRMSVLPLHKKDNNYFRDESSTLLEVPGAFLEATVLQTEPVYISRSGDQNTHYIKPREQGVLLYWHDLINQGYHLAERHPLGSVSSSRYVPHEFNFDGVAAGFWAFAKPKAITIILVCVVEPGERAWRLLEAPGPDYGLLDLLMDLGARTEIFIKDLKRIGHESLTIDSGRTLKIDTTKWPGDRNDIRLKLVLED